MALYGSLGVGQAFCMFGVGLAIVSENDLFLLLKWTMYLFSLYLLQSLIAYNNSRTMHGKGIQRLIFAVSFCCDCSNCKRNPFWQTYNFCLAYELFRNNCKNSILLSFFDISGLWLTLYLDIFSQVEELWIDLVKILTVSAEPDIVLIYFSNK